MTELQQLIWTEKYRPSKFDDLILQDKEMLIKYLANPKTIPSFIFYSSSPGTGKTSTAKIIIDYLQCDALMLNASDERGIDIVRDKIKQFAYSLSSDLNVKRCVFMDEADALTKQAADSLRNTMEEYADNVFFIFTANDISKIIPPIVSRCQIINFERPNKKDIADRLTEICELEKVSIDGAELDNIVQQYYPDVRRMVNRLQLLKVDNKVSIEDDKKVFADFLVLMQKKDIKAIYSQVYSGTFDIMGFNRWYFRYLFDNYNVAQHEKIRHIAFRLADTERAWNMGANLEVLFLANLLEVCKLL